LQEVKDQERKLIGYDVVFTVRFPANASKVTAGTLVWQGTDLLYFVNGKRHRCWLLCHIWLRRVLERLQGLPCKWPRQALRHRCTR
jgi:hypothetical protein